MKPSKTLLFFCSILLMLMLLCAIYPSKGIFVGGKKFRFPTLTEAMTKKDKDSISLEDKLNRVEEELRMNFVRDSLLQDSLNKVEEAERLRMAYEDTLKTYLQFFETSTAKISCPDNDPSILFSLFDELDQCAKGNSVRILHYGDSQIEQDRITSYIREQLQNKFGGWGAGMVPAVQPIPSITVGQTTTDSLRRYLADGTMRMKLKHDRYGVIAQMAELNGRVTLGFQPRVWKKTSAYPHVKKFSRVKLFVGNTGENFIARLCCPGNDTIVTVIDSAKADLSVMTWNLKSMAGSCTLELIGKGEIYGVSMEGKGGVNMDNIPLRGSSGTYFTKISKSLLSSSMSNLNVKLIILEFGGNTTPYIRSDKSLEAYKSSIAWQIAYLKRVCPNAKILFIGPADMSTTIEGELQTYPYLPTMVEGLRDCAMENGAMYWNMYDVMGGKNSMLQWVDHSPAWAGSDYVHFTETGANRIADMFVQSFMNYYDYYQFLKRNPQYSNLK